MVVSEYIKKERDCRKSKTYKEVKAYRYDTRYKGIHIKGSGFRTEALAKKALRDKMNEIDEQYPDEIALAARKKRERLESVVFENVLQEFYDYKALYVKDVRNIKEHFTKRIVPFYQGKQLHKLTINDIESWQRWLLDYQYLYKKAYIGKTKELDQENCVYKHYSSECIENSQIYLNEFLKFAVKKNYMKSNPMEDVKRVKRVDEIKAEMKYWTFEDYSAFINGVDDFTYNTLFATLYYTGMRIGECLGLQWSKINFAQNTIRINVTWNEKKHTLTTPKRPKSKRTILINKSLADQLKKLYEQSKDYDGFSADSFVFGIYKPLDDNTIRRQKNTYCKSNGVIQIRLHDFRHSHVSLLINNGFSPFEIADRIGDTVDMVLKTYAHMFAITQQNMVNFLENLGGVGD